ncbi:hypothetical protein B0T13DRAFT_474674 [Neurospora crassa]|nr:hypothetical protein B0T13DRAFT_474674 [Neurospora crassa]
MWVWGSWVWSMSLFGFHMGTTCWLLHFHMVFLCWFSRCTGFANSSMVYFPLVLGSLWRVSRTKQGRGQEHHGGRSLSGVVDGTKSIT